MNVKDQPVEIRGGYERLWHRPATVTHVGTGWTLLADIPHDGGHASIQLDSQMRGEVTTRFFENREEAEAEVERLSNLIILRDKITQVEDLLHDQGHLPTQFLAAVQAGDLMTLLVAADHRDDDGRGDDAVLLRSAYYRFAGESHVLHVSSNVSHHYNLVTGETMEPPTSLYAMRAAVVAHRESVRVLSLSNDPQEFRIGSRAAFSPGTENIMGKVEAIGMTAVGGKMESPLEERVITMAMFTRLNWAAIEMNEGLIGEVSGYNYAAAKAAERGFTAK